jgi:hypothetical protein
VHHGMVPETFNIVIGTANPTSVLDLDLIRACVASSGRLPDVAQSSPQAFRTLPYRQLSLEPL